MSVLAPLGIRDYARMAVPELIEVVDAGPIPYDALPLFQDPDLEQALDYSGYEPSATQYRLIRIPLGSIDMVRSGVWGCMGSHYIDAMRAGAQFPPIVVMPGRTVWVLLDGVNRTHAFWSLGVTGVLAYEVLGVRAQ
jgi:hypothetical protein